MTTAQDYVMTVPQITERITDLADFQQSCVDMVVPSRSITAQVGQIGEAQEPLINVDLGVGDESRFLVHIQDHAHNQIFQTGTDIGLHYGRKLLTAPELWATNVNHWLKQKEDNASYLLRTRKDFLRSFLSSRYKIVNNYDVALTTLRKATTVGAFPHRFDVSDTHMRLTYLMPNRTVDLNNNGDTHTFGFRVSNSEVGMGAVDVKPFLFRWACTNGLIMGTTEIKQGAMHKVHRGSDLPLGQLSSRTILKQSEVILSEAEDAIDGCLSDKMFNTWKRQLETANEQALADEPVKILQRTKFFTEAESTNILYELAQAQQTVFGMVQSMTATARNMTSDRRHEVETFAGKYLNELVPVR